jgi:glyceraldehyde-3-phosphate dehydrogenase/erythrose-4-phosphate dehydrogenase
MAIRIGINGFGRIGRNILRAIVESGRKDIDVALSIWPAEWMAQAGCVVHVDSDGTAAVKHGLVRPEDRSEVAQAARQTDAAVESGERGDLAPRAVLLRDHAAV